MDPAGKMREAVEAYERGEIQRAVKILKGLLHENPRATEVLMSLANLEHIRGNLEEARIYAERCLEYVPSWEMHDIMFDFYYSNKQYEKALKHIENALNLCEGEERELLREKKETLENELLNKLKVLHFAIDSPYIDRYVNFLAENFGFMKHTFVLSTQGKSAESACEKFRFVYVDDELLRNEAMIPVKVSVEALYPKEILRGDREIIQGIHIPENVKERLEYLLESHDIFIIHGFFGFSEKVLIPFLYKYPDYLDKAVYIPWTGDYFDMYWHLKELSTENVLLDLRNNLYALLFYMQGKVVKRISTIINLQGSLEEVSMVFGHEFGDPHLFAPYPIVTDFELLDELSNVNCPKDKRYILLGNSAHGYNRHMETLEFLSRIIDDGVSVVCPLSYPPRDIKVVNRYVEEVVEQGKKLFGKRFIPLLKMMPYRNYARVLSCMDVGVFNSVRRQGFGNIVALLYLGKKVYMSRTSLRKDFESLGIKVYPIERATRSDFFEYDEETAMSNRQRVFEAFSTSFLIEKWRRFFVRMAFRRR